MSELNDGYKHYIRLNGSNEIIHVFSDAFEEPQESDISIIENAPRHCTQVIVNDLGQFLFKWDGSKIIAKTPTELSSELSNLPPAPPTVEEQLRALQQVLLTML